MKNRSEVFEKHYHDYLSRLSRETDIEAVAGRLQIEQHENTLQVPFFNKTYTVSPLGILADTGKRASYHACVVLAQYILRCPKIPVAYDPQWTAFKDFKATSHFTNTNLFSSDCEKALATAFTGQVGGLKDVCRQFVGCDTKEQYPYDFVVQFQALPTISLLLLFNDADELFPAECKVLFQSHSEYYLDPESLLITGVVLAKNLIELKKNPALERQ